MDDGQVLDGGIFSDDSAAEGLKSAAKEFGIDPTKVDASAPQKEYYARSDCGICSGKGILSFVPSPQLHKFRILNMPKQIYERGTRKTARHKENGEWKRKPTQKKAKIPTIWQGNSLFNLRAKEEDGTIGRIIPDTENLWHTQRPEPEGYKKANAQHIPCKCLKAVEI